MSKFVQLTVYVDERAYEEFREGLDNLPGLIEVDWVDTGEM